MTVCLRHSTSILYLGTKQLLDQSGRRTNEHKYMEEENDERRYKHRHL
jgi:hypothetical protein